MANQFKSGEDAAGYLFDVAIRKGKDAARKEYERISGKLPQDQVDAMYKSIQNINNQKNIADDKGLGDAKVQRYREKAAKNMPVNYDKEFGKKPEPAPKPVAKAKPKAAEEENLKAPRPTESRVPIKPAAPKPAETPKYAQPFSVRGMSNFLGITPDKPAPNSRPAIGGGATQMLDLKAPFLKPGGKAPK